ncbi:chorismate mutase, partial [Streptomyces sp. NP-1717]|nr:chorismate mutase [Streptomyces sp. NP-1717]
MTTSDNGDNSGIDQSVQAELDRLRGSIDNIDAAVVH